MKTKSSPTPALPSVTADFIRQFQAAYGTLEHTLPFGSPDLRTRLEISHVLSLCIKEVMGGHEAREQRTTMSAKGVGKAARAALKKLGFTLTQPDKYSLRISWKA